MDCDKVFHKSSAKRCHFRLPVLGKATSTAVSRMRSCLPTSIGALLHKALEAKHPKDVRYESLLVVLYAALKLIDDRRVGEREGCSSWPCHRYI